MVRIKHRYLLLSILYPPTTDPKPPSASLANPLSSTTNPALSTQLQTHSPTPQTFTPGSLLRLLRQQIAVLFGDYGAGTLGGALSIKYFSNVTSTAIVRCPREGWRIVGAALASLTDLGKDGGGKRCVFRVVRVCGTVKKAEEEGVRRARELVGQVKALDVSEEENRSVEMAGLDLEEEDEDEDEDMWEDMEDG